MSSKNRTRTKQQRARAGTVLRKKQPRRKKEVSNLLGRFGRYLSLRREQENLTLRAFALRARMPYSNIFQMEALRKNPRLTELEKLAKGFNQSLSDFLKPVLEVPPPPVLESPQELQPPQPQESPQPAQ